MADAGDTRGTLTRLISERAPNDRQALDQVVLLVYEELRRLARRQLAGHRRHTTDTTALVDEAYLKLLDQESVPLSNRTLYFGAAARAMRQFLVDADTAQALELSRRTVVRDWTMAKAWLFRALNDGDQTGGE